MRTRTHAVALLIAASLMTAFSGTAADKDFPLMTAAGKGDVGEVKKLLAAGHNPNEANADGWTALHAAENKGSVEAVKVLVQAGANVNAAATNGTTPLFWASWRGDAEMVRALLESGADPNKPEKRGVVPLHVIVYEREPRPSEEKALGIVKLLLDHGADINRGDAMGAAARGIAASTGYSKVAEYLKSKGGKCTVKAGLTLHNCRD